MMQVYALWLDLFIYPVLHVVLTLAAVLYLTPVVTIQSVPCAEMPDMWYMLEWEFQVWEDSGMNFSVLR
jgi:hypothetical protein